MTFEYILNKTKSMTFGRLKRLVKANVLCREIGGYFDIMF